MDNPRKDLRGLGTMTVVGPEYSTRRGNDATNDRSILIDHLKSSTSSAKPRSNIIHMDSKPALYI